MRPFYLTTRLLVACFALTLCDCVACAQTAPPATDNVTADAKTAAELLTKLDQLVEKNQQLERQNHELVDQINALRQYLAKQAPGFSTATKEAFY